MNRIDRLLALILFLQSRRVTTAEDLARHFELSVRTIYRDLAALGEAGVPIAAEVGIGYTIRKGYHLPPVNFTLEEASALVTGARLAQPSTSRAFQMQMQLALAKVRAVLPPDQRERVCRLERSIATAATVPDPSSTDLDLLQRALGERRVIRFTYQTAQQPQPAERTVEPLGLIRYLERWHLIGWCRTRNDLRDFRTDRMNRVTMTRETFASRPDFSVEQYLRSMPQPTLRARVKFTVPAADRARREWWLGIIDERAAKDGVILTLAAVEWDRLVGWLLSFGSAAWVIAPEELRLRLSQSARALAEHHEKKVNTS